MRNHGKLNARGRRDGSIILQTEIAFPIDVPKGASSQSGHSYADMGVLFVFEGTPFYWPHYFTMIKVIP